jgi:hypothetical protein
LKYLRDLEVAAGSGTMMPVELYRLSNVELAEKKVPSSEATYASTFDFRAFVHPYFGKRVQMVLGMSLLRGKDWYFDLEKRLWAIR